MAGINAHDWKTLREKLKAGLKAGEVKPNFEAAALYLGVRSSTLRSAARREWNIRSLRDLIGQGLVDEYPSKLGIEVIEGLNELEINYVGEHAHTIPELIARCKIDENIWQAQEPFTNSWESPMKIKRGDDELIVVVPLYQVRARFIRKNPKPIMPMIAQVEVKIPPARAWPILADGVKRALIIADPQIGYRRRLHSGEYIPFHDRRVLDLALQIAKAERVTSVEFIGDWLDMSEFSTRFTPEPEFFWTTMPALIEAAWWLGRFNFVETKRLMEGNHEKRIRDWINLYARAAYGLRPVDELELPPSLSIERLIPMEKLGVEYKLGYPDNGYWLTPNVFIEHGDVVRSGAGDTAKAVVNKSTYTIVFGHVHRREMVSSRNKTRDGDTFQTAFCPGCACHIDGRVPGSNSKDQWQQGLGIVEYTEEAENLIPIAIQNGEAIYNGKVFKSKPPDVLDGELNDVIQKSLSKMAL